MLLKKSWTTETFGFSLIEIIIAITIISVTFGVIVSAYLGAQRSSRDSKRQSDLRTLQGALQHYYADQGYFPPTLSLGSATNISQGGRVYLNSIPKDPASPTQNYCYVAIGTNCAAATPNNCQSYNLYAKLENPPSGATTGGCGGSTATFYNLILSPP